MKKMINEGNKIHNFINSSGSDFLTSYGPVPVPRDKKFRFLGFRFRFRFHNAVSRLEVGFSNTRNKREMSIHLRL